MNTFFLISLIVSSLQLSAVAYSTNSNSNVKKNACFSRDAFLRKTIIATTASIFTASATTPSALAFDNRLDDKYSDRTPQVGSQPTNIGVKSRSSRSYPPTDYDGLAPCDTRPNCWCSSTPFKDAPARYIRSWDPPKSSSAIKEVKKIIDTYEVGQGGIDGGGYKVISEEEGYLYVQFQSYKSGYIDDVEFWYNSNKVDIRSASRLGQSDLGVNGKRLEYIGRRLEKEYQWNLNRRKNGSLV
mmetsp:Transcript_25038/g.27601  ORF Transcript_25038/g.27601 Transcript_25038/m.27601 type:complete len:242 (+) Transcript_25038:56-781(+)